MNSNGLSLALEKPFPHISINSNRNLQSMLIKLPDPKFTPNSSSHYYHKKSKQVLAFEFKNKGQLLAQDENLNSAWRNPLMEKSGQLMELKTFKNLSQVRLGSVPRVILAKEEK